MRITESQLRRIVRRMVEATRDPRNLEMDLQSMRPGDQIRLQVFDTMGVQPMSIMKRPASGRDASLYDLDLDDPDSAFVYEIKDSRGKPVISSVYPAEISDYFQSKGMEFSY